MAVQLLSSDESILQFSQSLGFDDPDYLARVLRNHIGCSPTEYRHRSAWTIAPDYQNNFQYVPDELNTNICQLDLTQTLVADAPSSTKVHL